MTEIPKLSPAVLASADQWLAGSGDSFAIPLANVREAIAADNTEERLASVAIGVAKQAIDDPRMCQGLAAAYILALYEMARLQQRIEKLEEVIG
jgi:hypothetical protein